MRQIITICCASPAMAGALPASAQNLKLKEAFASDRTKVAELAAQTSAACGSSIQFSIDYPSYSELPDDDNNQDPWA